MNLSEAVEFKQVLLPRLAEERKPHKGAKRSGEIPKNAPTAY
jgi:hypothetical protein